MRGTAIPYTAKELAWIKRHCTAPRREAHAKFCCRFGRTDVTLVHFNALCKRKGWATGRTGCFAKGHVPYNKGKARPSHPNSARTQFKKGNRTGRANENYKPIGSERLSKDGYLERKIHDRLPLQSRWRAVHLIQWEAVNGPLPKGHALKCVDGNRLNTDHSNWVLISRSLLPALSGRWGLNYDQAAPEVKPVLLTLAKLKHARGQRGKQVSHA